MTFSINHLTIQNAYSVQFGGGIVNAGKLIVTNSTFSHNQDTRAGGAIFCLGFADSLTVNASLFDTNSSFGDGGAISSGCQASISNSTFYNNNSAAGDGGAISVVSKVTTITNTTFSHNASGPGHATISSATGSALTLRNTILAGNTNANCSAISGTITDGGYNLDDDGSCGLSATGSLSGNANAHLGPLSSNGGPTQTIALQTGSAAIGGYKRLRDDFAQRSARRRPARKPERSLQHGSV